jgi:hypothetical protein
MIDNLIIVSLAGIVVLALFVIVGAIAEWQEWK